jgi:mannose-6-phosphate isomerase-like protein (cupin superfamily)
MNRQNKLVKKAKSGRQVIPGNGERPYTGGPVERFIFVDEELYPDTGIYQAVHLVKNLPEDVQDYMISHHNESDESYLFAGFEDDLSGLTVEVEIDGERIMVESPASFFIPQGVRHRYKAVSGKGMVLITLLQHSYSWVR